MPAADSMLTVVSYNNPLSHHVTSVSASWILRPEANTLNKPEQHFAIFNVFFFLFFFFFFFSQNIQHVKDNWFHFRLDILSENRPEAKYRSCTYPSSTSWCWSWRRLPRDATMETSGRVVYRSKQQVKQSEPKTSAHRDKVTTIDTRWRHQPRRWPSLTITCTIEQLRQR